MIDDLVDTLKVGLRDFIVKNAANIDFTQALYNVTREDEGQYHIKISITGLGEQHFSILLLGDEFLIKGKMAIIGPNAAFPYSLVSDLINGAIQKWITQTAENIATTKVRLANKGKSVKALPDHSLGVGFKGTVKDGQFIGPSPPPVGSAIAT
jgi:hypothetical protein